MLTSEFNPSENKIDVGDVDFNDNVVKKRILTNEVQYYFYVTKWDPVLIGMNLNSYNMKRRYLQYVMFAYQLKDVC